MAQGALKLKTLVPQTAAEELSEKLAQHNAGPHVFVSPHYATVDWAAAALERNSGNRELRERVAQKLARSMSQLRWRLTPEAVKFDWNGVLRDGQHRLRAVTIAGITVPMTVCYGCDPREADVYDQGLIRTAGDVAHWHGIPSANLSTATAGLILRIDQQDAISFDRSEVTERTIELHREDPHFIAAIRASARGKRLGAPSGLALAHWTIATKTSRYEKLEPFWSSLTGGADLTAGGPILRVRNELMEARNTRFSGSSRDMAVKRAAVIILAWNAWVQRRSPRYLKWDFVVRLPEVV